MIFSGEQRAGCRSAGKSASSTVLITKKFWWSACIRNFWQKQHLPPQLITKKIWKERFRDISNFEQYLTRNGVVIRKFFLHVSKEEQKRRFLARLDEPEKNWKFSEADVHERKYWDDYMNAYEDMIRHTSTPDAPWYVVPADHKWFTHIAVSSAIIQTLEDLDLQFPKVDKATPQATGSSKAGIAEVATRLILGIILRLRLILDVV